MIEGLNIIGYDTAENVADTFTRKDPSSGETLPGKFHRADQEAIDAALAKADEAFQKYRLTSGAERAEFLEAIADEIEALGDTLIERAMQESGLTRGRLEGERGRTTGQLRMFADLARDGSWCDARIDTGDPDVRSMKVAMGPVAVFGASNFPLAFSTAGGDTASALAAGCPVVVKSHESHPGTNELAARAVQKAARDCDMPDGVFSSLNGARKTGALLVEHPLLKAVGFTGSYSGGKAIFDLASRRDEPIPVYAEMGSVNPLFLLEEKLAEDTYGLADELAGSVTLGVGQFCTNPGVIVGMAGDDLEAFKQALADKLKGAEAGCMLNEGIAKNYREKRAGLLAQKGVQTLVSRNGQESGNLGAGAMAGVSAGDFLANPELQEEVFGPFTLVVACEDEAQRLEVVRALKGQLTVSFMGTDDDFTGNRELIQAAREIAGRVIFNAVPTGVRVCDAMHHGGPFPATLDVKFTSVGTRAIERFARPLCWQDAPRELLPDELKDGNPLGIRRMVDGEYGTD
ncbi:MAG: aldehyde dehydrogenase (NADP(+)) [Balneolaceae bacterium]|nr:aldehyde dehydrogenase (NADP(+)) [Balneolaceae bacterium]